VNLSENKVIEDINLLDEVERALLLKAPLLEFDSVSNEQIIMSPAFQQRIFDALLDLLPSYHNFTTQVLENNSLLISFTKEFVNFYRKKQLTNGCLSTGLGDDSMSKYCFPNLSAFQVIFNGRRYKAFRVSKSEPFNEFEEDADFVVWDGLYDAVVSYGNISTDGTFNGFLAFSSVEVEIDSSADISEFVRNSSKAQQRFFKDAGA
jgi:hypothetical protein